MQDDDCNRASLKCIPDDVMKILIEEKADRMKRTNRVKVSLEETIYGIVREWDKISKKNDTKT